MHDRRARYALSTQGTYRWRIPGRRPHAALGCQPLVDYISPFGGGYPSKISTSSAIADGSMIGDVDPYYDTCSDNSHATSGALGALSGENIGDLLNGQHVT